MNYTKVSFVFSAEYIWQTVCTNCRFFFNKTLFIYIYRMPHVQYRKRTLDLHGTEFALPSSYCNGGYSTAIISIESLMRAKQLLFSRPGNLHDNIDSD